MVYYEKLTKSLCGTEQTFFAYKKEKENDFNIELKSRKRKENQDSIYDSKSRAIQKIKDYAKNTHFQYFSTLTFNPKKYDSTSKDYVKSILSKFNRYLRRHKVKYIEVLEYHKDGKKLHVHALIKGDLPMYVNDNGYLSIAWWSKLNDFGYSSVKKINQGIVDIGKISNYITKYMTKELFQEYNAKKYYCSKGLPVSKVVSESTRETENNTQNTVFDIMKNEGYTAFICEFKNGSDTFLFHIPLTNKNAYELQEANYAYGNHIISGYHPVNAGLVKDGKTIRCSINQYALKIYKDYI